MQEWFGPGAGFASAFTMQEVSHRPEVLAGMVEVQQLRCAGPPIRHHVPDPGRAIGHDQHVPTARQSVAQGFPMQPPPQLQRFVSPDAFHAALDAEVRKHDPSHRPIADGSDIAAWGQAHLPFLRRFLPYEYGVPGERWLNILMNRIDPQLFSACFMSWASELRADAPALLALDGKTSRRTHDRSAGKAALHLVSGLDLQTSRGRQQYIDAGAKLDKANALPARYPISNFLGKHDTPGQQAGDLLAGISFGD